MKKLILTSAILLSFATHAQKPADPCADVKTVAAQIMTARQSGVDASVTIGRVHAAMQGNKSALRSIIKVVVAAYQMPIQDSELKSKRIISEFANAFYISCWSTVI